MFIPAKKRLVDGVDVEIASGLARSLANQTHKNASRISQCGPDDFEPRSAVYVVKSEAATRDAVAHLRTELSALVNGASVLRGGSPTTDHPLVSKCLELAEMSKAFSDSNLAVFDTESLAQVLDDAAENIGEEIDFAQARIQKCSVQISKVVARSFIHKAGNVKSLADNGLEQYLTHGNFQSVHRLISEAKSLGVEFLPQVDLDNRFPTSPEEFFTIAVKRCAEVANTEYRTNAKRAHRAKRAAEREDIDRSIASLIKGE